jgi:hypothetical protein
MIRSITTKTLTEMEREMLNRTKVVSERPSETRLGQRVTPGVFLLLVMMSTRVSLAQEAGPKTFSSAGEAARALFLAVRNEDEQSVGAILGAGREVTSANDEVEDKLERERFSQKYQEMHRLVREPDGKTVLYIGAENWPFPIPLVSKNGRWYFDSDTGTREIVFRKVGENETTAIEVCRAFVTARKHETKSIGDDQISQYADSLTTIGSSNSDETTDDTLKKDSSLFHGYYFQIATEQTADAATGSNAYISPAKKSAQAVLVAFPDEYRGSGVMTFVVTQDGAVYQKDLGTDTARLGPAVLKGHIIRSAWEAVK